MHLQAQQGLMNTYRAAWRRRGPMAWVISAGLFAFYVALYKTEVFTPLAQAVGLRDKWFLYGAIYSVGVIGGGAWYLRRHGNSRYNRARIATNVVVQVLLAWLLPFFMEVFGAKQFYFSYLWPLKIDYLYPATILEHPILVVLYSVLGSLVMVPLLTVAFGKRWYCSWVCGCGALANTFGDPWRHLSSKSTRAWRFEQVSIHAVLILALVTTGVVGVNWAIGEDYPRFASVAWKLQGFYGFAIGMVLSGIAGTALYPVMGPRVWCRFFCPMAALLGLAQKLGRFHVRVKEDMCISCGNCSTYCEMGIDVRAYAQSNQSFTRASCVGCGMCAHVCPRGVLKLENRWSTHGDKERQSIVVLDL